MFDEGSGVFTVVVNDEDQHSIWPDDREPPAGWRRTGYLGSLDSCLAHIESVWIDMRPRSLRQWLSTTSR